VKEPSDELRPILAGDERGNEGEGESRRHVDGKVGTRKEVCLNWSTVCCSILLVSHPKQKKKVFSFVLGFVLFSFGLGFYLHTDRTYILTLGVGCRS
jgi:hypothetical protein